MGVAAAVVTGEGVVEIGADFLGHVCYYEACFLEVSRCFVYAWCGLLSVAYWLFLFGG